MATRLPHWAQSLDLAPHPEGGWFRENWRSDLTLPQSVLPSDYAGERSAGTAILYLLLPGEQSAWHTVRSAEIWLYHRGSPMQVDIANPDPAPANPSSVLLGADHPQFVVGPRHWQRARPTGAEASLVSCVVVPGFDFADFALEPKRD